MLTDKYLPLRNSAPADLMDHRNGDVYVSPEEREADTLREAGMVEFMLRAKKAAQTPAASRG